MLFSFCSPWLSSNIHPLSFAFPRPARLHPLCFSIFVHSIFYDLLCNLSLWRKYSGAMTGYISHPSFFFSLLSSHSDLCVWVRWLTMEPCSYGPAFNEIPPTTNLGFCLFNSQRTKHNRYTYHSVGFDPTHWCWTECCKKQLVVEITAGC